MQPYKKPNIYKNRGQSLVEFAILGSVVIMLFAWMLSFGQSFNASQAVSMHAFRKAEKHARERSEKGRLGSVTFTTIAPTRQLNIVNTKGSPSEATGSASVMWENELFAFAAASEESELDEDDAPITFYQIGENMIRENTAYKWPLMEVKREVKYPAARDYKGWFFNIFAQVIKFLNDVQAGSAPDLELDYYYSLESQPSYDSYKIMTEDYEIDETLGQAGGKARSTETSENTVITTTTFKMLDKATIEKWDDNIEKVEYMEHPEDVNIVMEQTLRGTKSWESDVK